ncbi:hypothetical protein H257_05341 [Aphanomyces astaci]|uniref:Uncharacterized protein n=1 Tax=Aphanomyces astaci TaxID=112090 RepID=W4GRW1_APHAT|nr:hypothetical protein H257_05341 [Aphanomyces astaci]ETV81749.1 hypothetical protein H257_05341 [Aphanomyces astaci]|eukprot:XP_009828486.1 hypothetical protein H257_05341 [Aphanomyces astaci]
MSSSLWKSADAAEWRAMYDTYDNVRESLEDKLEALEKWFHAELPLLVRAQGYITQSQLSKLMQWKLSKGKWRPRLQSFVDALTDKQVQDLSTKAFVACTKKSYREATAVLSELKGVGPATASAVLAAFDPAVPFMGDEALNALTSEIGARQYTLPHFVRFLDTVQAKASALNESITDDGGHVWTAQQVQLCLWLEQAAQSSRSTTPKAKPPTKKRPKRSASSELQLPANKRTTRRSSTR